MIWNVAYRLSSSACIGSLMSFFSSCATISSPQCGGWRPFLWRAAEDFRLKISSLFQMSIWADLFVPVTHFPPNWAPVEVSQQTITNGCSKYHILSTEATEALLGFEGRYCKVNKNMGEGAVFNSSDIVFYVFVVIWETVFAIFSRVKAEILSWSQQE